MIEILKLTKRYGDFTAVDDIDLVVPRGELFGFLGPNGAGKTTTLRMIAGILKPTSGTIRVAGVDVAADHDGSGGGRDETGDHAHGGGLAGAVGPEEAEDFAALHRERDPCHGPFCSEMFLEVFDFYHVSCSAV